VPSVKIAVAPARVAPGEPFSVTLTASAPFGLRSMSWHGVATGAPALDAEHERSLAGEAVGSVTWSGLTIETPGTYVLAADAADLRLTDAARPGYPHRASEAEPAPTADITVLQRSYAVSR
jgi:hypothetical protein